MMEIKIIIFVVALSIISAFAACFLAKLLQDLLVRLRNGRPITWTDQCGKTIETVPTRMPWAYVTISTLLMSPMAYYFGFGIQMAYVFLMLTLFLAIAVLDIKYRLIPNWLVLGVIGVQAVWMFAPYLHGVEPEIWFNLREYALGMLLCFAVFFGGTMITGGKVGMGDVKLSMAIGFMLGWRKVLIAIALSGLLMIPFVFTRPGMNIKERFKLMVPFGPPFSLAALLVLVAGFTPLARFLQF